MLTLHPFGATDLSAQAVTLLQNQTQATEARIKGELEQLREFLQREEEARLATLQQESEEKKELVRKKSEGITSGILSFSHAVIAVENEIASADVVFLKVGLSVPTPRGQHTHTHTHL